MRFGCEVTISSSSSASSTETRFIVDLACTASVVTVFELKDAGVCPTLLDAGVLDVRVLNVGVGLTDGAEGGIDVVGVDVEEESLATFFAVDSV